MPAISFSIYSAVYFSYKTIYYLNDQIISHVSPLYNYDTYLYNKCVKHQTNNLSYRYKVYDMQNIVNKLQIIFVHIISHSTNYCK